MVENVDLILIDVLTASYVLDGYGGIRADNLAAELLENPGLIPIDARTPGEWAEKGVIVVENFFAIPLEDFIALKSE